MKFKFNFPSINLWASSKSARTLSTGIIYVLLTVFFTGFVLSWLSYKNAMPSGQMEIRSKLRQLDLYDSQWMLDIWKIKDSTYNVYPENQKPIDKILEIRNSLDSDFSKMSNKKLTALLSNVDDIIEKKKQISIDFDSQIFLLKNSLSFFSVESFKLDNLIESELLPINTAKKHSNDLLVFYSSLLDLNKSLISESLRFSVVKTDEARTLATNTLADIETKKNSAGNVSPAITEQLEIVTGHAETIINEVDAEGELLDKVEKLSFRDVTKKIDDVVFAEYANNAEKMNSYWSQMLFFGVLFSLTLLTIFYRSFRSARDIKAANTLLEATVFERTKEVTKAMESLKESQVQLVQAEKMSSVGQMVAGVAHEINTPLGYVKSNLQVTKSRMFYLPALVEASLAMTKVSDVSSDEAVKEAGYVLYNAAIAISGNEILEELATLNEESLDGILKISEIVIGLKDFSRIDRVKTTKFNVHEGLNSTIKIASNITKGKKIIKNFDPDLPSVLCSPSEINQVFLNLITNASQATGNDGIVTIKTFSRDDKVCISISDNGTGISEEVMSKIFEPFFTTKPIGTGTGLGLSICQKIIQSHQGRILVQSKEGVGTLFTIELPSFNAALPILTKE